MYQGGWMPATNQLPHDYNMGGIPAAGFAPSPPQQAPATASEDPTADPGKCQRKEPPCKYLHPPQHLKEQLLQNGRQNLALKYQYNLLAQNQLAAAQLQASTIMPGMTPMQSAAAVPMATPLAMDGTRYMNAAAAAAASHPHAALLHGTTGLANQHMITAHPYLYQYAAATGLPASHLAASAAGIGQLQQAQLPFASVSQALAQIPSSAAGVNTSTALTTGQKAPRADRLEEPNQLVKQPVCSDFSKDGSCSNGDEECDKAHPPDYVLTEDDLAVVCMDFVKGKCTREHCKYYHPTQKLLAKVNQNRAALAAANQANTHAAQQALSQVLTAAVLHQAPPPVHTPQALLGLAAGGAAANPTGQAVSAPTAAASALTPQVSQASMVAALQGYPTAVSALAGLAGAYQPTAMPTSAVSPNRGLQAAAAAAAAATAVPGQDATALGQAQAKKRQREEEIMMSVGGVPGMPMQIKRQALDAKAGIPMFNPAAAYQQLAYAPTAAAAATGQPAYVPVSFAGHPASMPRL